MKKIIFALVFLVTFAVNAQNESIKEIEKVTKAIEDTTRQQGWTRKGEFTLLANQSSFKNWLAGGTNNLSGTLNVNYDFNYKKGDFNWDNKIIAAYGLTKISGAETQKTDDRLMFNSLVGKRAKGYWFYSGFFNFNTQMDTGLDPGTQSVKISHFFSPAYFQAGPGMLWKKSDNFKFNIAPATSKLIVVHDHFTEFGPSFGVEQGSTTRYEFGAALNGYYKFNVMENVSVEQIVNLYSNYLEDPQNVDVDYQVNIVMKINKYLSTNFAFQTIYDDNAFRGFQTRQLFGLGVNYGF